MIPNEYQSTFILRSAGFLWSKYNNFEIAEKKMWRFQKVDLKKKMVDEIFSYF